MDSAQRFGQGVVSIQAGLFGPQSGGLPWLFLRLGNFFSHPAITPPALHRRTVLPLAEAWSAGGTVKVGLKSLDHETISAHWPGPETNPATHQLWLHTEHWCPCAWDRCGLEAQEFPMSLYSDRGHQPRDMWLRQNPVGEPCGLSHRDLRSQASGQCSTSQEGQPALQLQPHYGRSY